MGYVTRVPGTAILAASHNTEYRDQVCSHFATTTARDAAITSPIDGMEAHIAADGYYYVYKTGTGWRKSYAAGIADQMRGAWSNGAGTALGALSAAGNQLITFSTELYDVGSLAAPGFTSITLPSGAWIVQASATMTITSGGTSGGWSYIPGSGQVMGWGFTVASAGAGNETSVARAPLQALSNVTAIGQLDLSLPVVSAGASAVSLTANWSTLQAALTAANIAVVLRVVQVA